MRSDGYARSRAASLSRRDFETVRGLVKEHAAIVLEPGKSYLVEARLTPIAQSLRAESLASLVETLRTTPFGSLHARVVDAMTTNETSFFRDLHPFEALRKAIVPEILRRREVERKIHVWCGASSSGQEPYSIAMLLHEHFPQLRDWSVVLIATDISEEMLERARAGRFSRLEVSRGLPAPLLVRYFERAGAEWKLAEEVRRMVTFRTLNLVKPWPPLPPLDLVFLRNVMLYFDLEARREILGRIRRALQPDGYLFLGAAETTLHADDAFERVAVERSWAYRVRRS
ncbi:MAG: protein-glutamate O-methyltransferase CheR [Deltaproteobacteria bacterium]|nr:protein-glutamate O-methyltransferase CheR [Deltaproteobacteria bacterium]